MWVVGWLVGVGGMAYVEVSRQTTSRTELGLMGFCRRRERPS